MNANSASDPGSAPEKSKSARLRSGADVGVNVGYFLELERTFQRKRVVRSEADDSALRDAAILRAT
jgi:hypothetical protein